MTDEPIVTTQEAKTKQQRNLLILSGVAVMVVLGIYYGTNDGASSEASKQKAEIASFSSPANETNTQSVWMERAQNRMKEQEKQTAALQSELTQLKNQNTQQALEENPHFQALQKQNQWLQEALKTKEAKDVKEETLASKESLIPGGNAYHGQVFATTPGALVPAAEQGQQGVVMNDVTGIDNDELQLKSISSVPKKNADSFVPSGTFAEAIMLGAADASAGVQAQSNPSPMLFRIVADGTLPNHQKSHLKDCVVTAAVVGDISSERGQIRLERMSCTFPNGEIVEQMVDGTVFGMDAKNGVRGTPVWREGALLGRAAVAGTLSGLGSAISQTYTTHSISALGDTQTVNNGDIFKYGASQGASTAMEKLSDYNIRRAEQYHPVIQLSAGQAVDVVFLKGFYLDGRTEEGSHDTKAATTELFPASPGQTPSGLTLSERELEKIKQNERALGWVQKSEAGGLQ